MSSKHKEIDHKQEIPSSNPIELKVTESVHYLFLRTAHDWFFDKKASTSARMLSGIEPGLIENTPFAIENGLSPIIRSEK